MRSWITLSAGEQATVEGTSVQQLALYADEICASGFPGFRKLSTRARNAQLDSYIDRIIDVEFVEQGYQVAKPAALRGWLTAFAAATSTTASYNTILDAATPGDSNKPAKTTTIQYREMLTKLFITDPCLDGYRL
jgi:uncharacterized protein